MAYVEPGASKLCGWFVLSGRRIFNEDGTVARVVQPSELPCVLRPGHEGAHMTNEEAFAASRGRPQALYAPDWWYEGSARTDRLAGDWRTIMSNGKPRTQRASAWS